MGPHHPGDDLDSHPLEEGGDDPVDDQPDEIDLNEVHEAEVEAAEAEVEAAVASPGPAATVIDGSEMAMSVDRAEHSPPELSQDGQGWWSTNSPSVTSPNHMNPHVRATVGVEDISNMETLPYVPECLPSSPAAPSGSGNLEQIDARIALLQILSLCFIC